jgi:kexin
MTAVPFDAAAPNDWQETSLGKKFSHQFGYGKLNAYAIVEAAKTWQNFNPQAWYFSPWIHVNHSILQSARLGLTSAFEVTAEAIQNANLKRVEHVTVTMSIKHYHRRGNISVELKSPNGITSHVATTRPRDEVTEGYNWTFMSVAHWGEDGIGQWTVIVKVASRPNKNGTFTDWRLKLYGEAIDGANQALLPLPTEIDDAYHKEEADNKA